MAKSCFSAVRSDAIGQYDPRLSLIYRQLARLIVKVLHGVKPEHIPAEQLTKFDLVVNLKPPKAFERMKCFAAAHRVRKWSMTSDRALRRTSGLVLSGHGADRRACAAATSSRLA